MSGSSALWAFDQPWFIWAIALILVFPALIVLVGEIIHRLQLSNSAWVGPFKNVRHLILPQAVFLLILTKVLGLENSSTAVRIVETLLWIFVIHTGLAIINVMLFQHVNDEDNWRAKIPKLVVDFSRAFLVAVGASLVLSYVWGVELGRLITALGVGSIVLGLALQDTLGSLFSGFALLSSRQFRVGDWLKVSDDDVGEVIGMNWRTVTLLTRDEDIIIVPNAELARGKFVNFSHPYPRHLERVPFDISFDDSPHIVKKALLEAAMATPGVLHDPPPSVALMSYDVFSVRHEVRYFIEHFKDQPRILDDFKSRVWYVNQRYGISFPDPVQQVYINHPPPPQETAKQETDHVREIIESLPFLRTRSEHHDSLVAASRVLPYGAREEIISQGHDVDHFYILISGKALEYFVDRNGKSHDLNVLGRRDFFGLNALVRGESSDVSVRCTDDVSVLAIDREAVEELMEDNPDLASEMERVIEGRTREVETLTREAQIHEADEQRVNEDSHNVVAIKKAFRL